MLVLGSEPNFRWRSYTDAVCAIAVDLGVELVVTLGALLADTPHTRAGAGVVDRPPTRS